MFLTPDHLVRELSLKPGDTVADIGCGTGAYTIALSKEVGDIGHVYAVDVHRDILHRLEGTLERQNILNVETVWADVEQGIPIEAYSLDAVVLSNVLFQLSDMDSCIRYVSKILKPECELLIVDWSDSHGGIGPHKDHVIKEEDVEQLISKYGFRVLKRLPAGDYHFALIAISK